MVKKRKNWNHININKKGYNHEINDSNNLNVEEGKGSLSKPLTTYQQHNKEIPEVIWSNVSVFSFKI